MVKVSLDYFCINTQHVGVQQENYAPICFQGLKYQPILCWRCFIQFIWQRQAAESPWKLLYAVWKMSSPSFSLIFGLVILVASWSVNIGCPLTSNHTHTHTIYFTYPQQQRTKTICVFLSPVDKIYEQRSTYSPRYCFLSLLMSYCKLHNLCSLSRSLSEHMVRGIVWT